MSQTSGPDGRETSTKTIRRVSRVEEAGGFLEQAVFQGGIMPDIRICFGDRGSTQSGRLERSCGSRSSARDRGTLRMGDRATSR
jgi:hypothetical protein